MNIKTSNKYYFVGIKGSGMSALAQILKGKGCEVRGADVEEEFFTQKRLEVMGIQIESFPKMSIAHDEIAIIGNAFKDEHPAVEKAMNVAKESHRYHKFLGEFVKNHLSIAVSGTHGKTSTTGIGASVLGAQFKTDYLIGDGTGEGDGAAETFIFEACEYRNHFHAFNPSYTIITNIEHDHPDFFKTEQEVLDSFKTFARQTKTKVIGCGDDPGVREVSGSASNFLTYGFDEGNEFIIRSTETKPEGTYFSLYQRDKLIGHYMVHQFGKHHVLNATAVIIIAKDLDMDDAAIQKGLDSFKGVGRRFNVYEVGESVVVDDYAHHPTEIKATIESARLRYPGRKIVSVFQPHTFSRTKQFLHEFAKSFEGSDVVYLVPIFSSAREQSGDVTIYDLIELTKKSNYLTRDNLIDLKEHEGAVYLFMGAGNINKMMDEFKETILPLSSNEHLENNTLHHSEICYGCSQPLKEDESYTTTSLMDGHRHWFFGHKDCLEKEFFAQKSN